MIKAQKKILIVDDSATARLLFTLCFNDRPEYEIIQSSYWQESIELAASQHPFLVVLDYNMPEKTGIEVAKKMQAAGLKAYYILLTANTQQHIIEEAQKTGFFDILEKPITKESIEKLLERLA